MPTWKNKDRHTCLRRAKYKPGSVYIFCSFRYYRDYATGKLIKKPIKMRYTCPNKEVAAFIFDRITKSKFPYAHVVYTIMEDSPSFPKKRIKGAK